MYIYTQYTQYTQYTHAHTHTHTHTVTNAVMHAEETLSTLKFATRAKTIKNTAEVSDLSRSLACARALSAYYITDISMRAKTIKSTADVLDLRACMYGHTHLLSLFAPLACTHTHTFT